MVTKRIPILDEKQNFGNAIWPQTTHMVMTNTYASIYTQALYTACCKFSHPQSTQSTRESSPRTRRCVARHLIFSCTHFLSFNLTIPLPLYHTNPSSDGYTYFWEVPKQQVRSSFGSPALKNNKKKEKKENKKNKDKQKKKKKTKKNLMSQYWVIYKKSWFCPSAPPTFALFRSKNVFLQKNNIILNALSYSIYMQKIYKNGKMVQKI